MNRFKSPIFFLALGAVLGTAFADQGAVFTETNQSAGNEVAVYARGADGRLTLSGSYTTGGLGTGAGLGSQGAVTLSRDGRFLYAVDAGSNDVAVFRVEGRSLRAIGRYDSGGTTPISVTESRGLVYVLNAGGAGNIAGFRVRPNGSLQAIAFSSRALSGAGAGPAQIQFSPQGDVLVVTEKGTNTIDSWRVSHGVPGALSTTPASGQTPFGFDFDNRGRLVVSEAFGGAQNGSAASSYRLASDGWDVITGSAWTHQTAACWTAVSRNGRFAYVTNAGSASITGYSISAQGALELLNSDGFTAGTGTGSHPTDLAFTRSGRFLYALNSSFGTIAEFELNADGSLTPVGTASVQVGSVGLAAN